MKKFTALLLAGAMMASLAACGPKESAPAASGSTPAASGEATLDPITLRGADSSGKGSAAQLLGELFAAKMEENSNGAITVDYFPNSEMGGDMDTQQAMLDGTLDYVVMQTAPSVSFVPGAAVFDLPMVFAKYDGDKIDQVLNGADSEFHKAISEQYAEKNFRILGFLQNATYRLTTSNKALDNLDAFKGFQIRTMENPNHMAFWEALGAAPTPMAWPEVYISLQNGTIAGQENAADTCATSNFQEVQKYLNFTNHILYLNQVVMNNDKYNSLAPEYQEIIDESISEAIAELRPQLESIDKDNKAKLEEGGMTMVEYAPEFYDEILALPGVQALYEKIDADVNGLGTVLQESLAK